MRKLLILTGPNLNMLGKREPEIYGHQTLGDVESLCHAEAAKQNLEIDFRQTNHEGVLVDWIQEAMNGIDGVIINAGAYTHTSLAIHDALKLLDCPIIEVHISDPSKREEFRHFSYISPLATEIIKGQGADGYRQAVEIINKHFK